MIARGSSRVAGAQAALMVVGLIVLSVIIGMGVGGKMPVLGLAVVVALGAVVCLVYPFLGVVVLVSITFMLNWLVYLGVASSRAQYAEDALALALLGAVVLHTRQRQRLLARIPGGLWVLVFLALAIIGAALNGTSAVAAIVGLRNVWLMFVLALASATLDWRPSQRRFLVYLLVAFALAQAPVAVAQFAFLRTGTSGDAVGGTLGGSSSGALTVLMLGMTTLMIGVYLQRAAPRGRVALAIALLMLPPALNETKVFFVAAPVIFGIVLLTRIGRQAGAVVVSGMLITALGFAVFQGYAAVYGSRFQGTQGSVVARMVEQEMASGTASGGVMKRLPSVGFAFEELAQSPATLLFGHGAGSLTRSALTDTRGQLIVRYGALLQNTVFLVRLLLEYGLFGLVAFCGVLVSIYRKGRALEANDGGAFWRACGVGLQGFVITLGFLSIYTGTFTTDALAGSLWLLAGICGAQLAERGESESLDPAALAA